MPSRIARGSTLLTMNLLSALDDTPGSGVSEAERRLRTRDDATRLSGLQILRSDGMSNVGNVLDAPVLRAFPALRWLKGIVIANLGDLPAGIPLPEPLPAS